MILIIHLFSLSRMINLYNKHEYLQKYLSQDEGNTFLINEGASITDIKRILKGESIKFKIKQYN